jgi:hypothetical protein
MKTPFWIERIEGFKGSTIYKVFSPSGGFTGYCVGENGKSFPTLKAAKAWAKQLDINARNFRR